MYEYKVNILTRNKSITSINENLNYFFWNPVTKEIDSKCFEDIDSVINLAGFNVFNFWVKKNKSKMLEEQIRDTLPCDVEELEEKEDEKF